MSRPDLITNRSAADGIARLIGDARRSAEWRPGSVGPAVVEGEPIRSPRKRSGTSPTQRTLAYLRGRGWQVAVTEHWQAIPRHPAGGVRKDLWGFGDLLAVTTEGAHAIIQTTSTGVTDRCKKIDGIPEAVRWLRSGGEILVIGWRKLKPRGQKVPHWKPRLLFGSLSYTGNGSVIRWDETEDLQCT